MFTSSNRPELTAPARHPGVSAAEYHWLWVLCLLGLDYFSTLAYQPSITYQETQRLGPLATTVVVLVTLFGALPVYCYLAGRSPGGQGSLGILDKLVRGWRGKTLVLVLLGFAATDFTLLKSLSLADAAVHVLNKQDGLRLEGAKHVVAFVKDCATEYCGDDAAHQVTDQLIVTILLGVIATLFWFLLRKGFTRKVMFCAVPLVGIYLVMSGIVIGSGLWLLWQNPALATDWFEQVSDGRFELAGARPASDGWGLVVLLSFLALPKLALGLSGFEMSMILMPQVVGKPGEQPPRTRIRNVSNCVSAAHAIAAIALEMSRKSKPPSVHFGWPEMDMLSASWSYLAFGEGNIPWKVRELIHRAEKDPARRPRVIVG